MTILDFLTRLGGASGDLIALLTAAGDASPDLKPKADEWIALLSGTVDPANLALVASALPAEAKAIFLGQFDPHDHPSDAI